MRLTPTAVRELLERHGIEPSRALGQNFMVDSNTIDRIVRLAGVERGDRVVEVGPGVGALTVALAGRGASVLAIEADRHLIAPLTEVLEAAVGTDIDKGSGPGRVEIVHADATHFDWARHIEGNGWKFVANLPYNVATPLVLDVLKDLPAVEELTFLVQQEVGERFVAEPGSRAFGLPSLHASYWCTGSIVAKIPSTVFYPRPAVESVLVRLVRRPEPLVDAPFESIMRLARIAFGQRRKMLRRSLAGVVDDAGFVAADVDPTARPEVLGLPEWSCLVTAVESSPGAPK